jgi:cell division protein FtsQ
MIGRAFAAIPFPEGFPKGVRNWTLGLLLVGGIGAGVVAMGLPGMAGMALAHAAGRAGLVVRSIEVNGRSHVDRDAVYRVAMDWRGQDMPLVDLAGIRQALLGLAWVEDARVSRRLPDTLVVDIVERKPAGVWQHDYKLSLIDPAGRVIAAVDPTTPMDQLPLVVGPDANLHAAEFTALVASQPVLKPLIEGATWIGGRRWDVRFQSGETLMLPEGDKAARDALALFARKDSEARLLGQGIVRFDMRVPDRMVVRMSQEPGAKVATPPPPANQI